MHKLIYIYLFIDLSVVFFHFRDEKTFNSKAGKS